jgi:hypothetical protein
MQKLLSLAVVIASSLRSISSNAAIIPDITKIVNELCGAEGKSAIECQKAQRALLEGATQKEIDNFKKFGAELSNVTTPELTIYQYVDDVCNKLDCYDLPKDKIRAVISSEISFRSDLEKTGYTRISTITGSASTLISVLSLCVSVLTYRRGKARSLHSNQREPQQQSSSETDHRRALHNS